jgi:hypothetical protein
MFPCPQEGHAMNWKTDLRLNDLETTTEIEIVCKRCGLARTLRAAQLIKSQPDLALLYFDEVEASLHCSLHHCRGGVRISILHDDKNEGFVGGMA